MPTSTLKVCILCACCRRSRICNVCFLLIIKKSNLMFYGKYFLQLHFGSTWWRQIQKKETWSSPQRQAHFYDTHLMTLFHPIWSAGHFTFCYHMSECSWATAILVRLSDIVQLPSEEFSDRSSLKQAQSSLEARQRVGGFLLGAVMRDLYWVALHHYRPSTQEDLHN